MQAIQLTIAKPNIGHIGSSSMKAKLGDWVARVFGCWHAKLSRPFSHQGQAYRVCINCGAQRQFNLRNWTMQGEFYYRDATTRHLQAFHGLAAVKRTYN
jgi:hypothetical protein